MIELKNSKRNTIKTAEPEGQSAKPSRPVKERKNRFRKISMKNRNISVGKSLTSVLDGSFLTKENLLRQIPFMVFITFLGIIYIANSYNAEKTIIEINKTKKQLEELRYEYITIKSNLMFQSKQSEVAYRLAASQVKESTVPPVKLIKHSDAK